MTESFVPLTSDGIFKAFFRQEEYLKMFLEDTLKIKIKKIEFQDSLLEREYEDNKECRLDLIVLLDDNSYISVEMQNEKEGDMIYRSHYYLNKITTRSLNKGKRYDEIKKFIAINIINYKDERFKKLHHICKLCDIETKKIISDVEEIHIISIKSNEINDEGLREWLEILKEGKSWNMNKFKEKRLEKAVKELKRLSRDKEVMELYDREMKEKIDTMLTYNQGKSEAKEEAAKKFYQNGVDKEVICQSLNLTEEQLEEILNKNN